ncbi:PLxRFG domain-containing protein [Salinivibrio proteolyticus]|uniref:PLxRFG domain-containing protein n=1 Tax=Salinivibrio proteolyticus TaxID=334715 RepID=A0ABY7L9A6_9GAMM|nr:PLxRFG domain-containing protein [Salinivibrio proteolyticus]WBA13832.1 PLxRFG domain-containing protein [Salinivibrio proteolyticus]
MKDDKLLGKTDGATVNAQTDMTFQLSDNFNLDAYKPQENVEVGAGDVAIGLAVGASGAMEGAAETTKAVGQGIGEGMTDLARYVGVPDSAIETAKSAAAYTPQGMALSYVDNLRKAYGQAKDWLGDSLSDGGKQALQTLPINESPEGNWRVSSDPAVWGMQIAQGLGYMAPTIASAVATGGMSASSAIPSLTKLAIKSGANPQLAAKAAEKAYQVLRNTPAATVGISSDIGSQGIQAKETVMNAPLDQLAESNVFRSNFFTVDEDPENVGRSDSEKLDMARQMTAEQASRATMSDEKVLATSALATMLGDVPLANMLTRGASKASSSITRGVAKGATEGAIREGVTEAIQGGTQQYAANEISNEYAGTNVDLMDGVAIGAVNEGVLGGAIGGTLGAAGGTRTRADKARDNADAIENDMAQAGEPEGNTKDTDDSQLVEDVQGMESVRLPSNDETMITDGPSEAAERVRRQVLDKTLSEGNQEWEKPEVDGQGDLASRFKASQQSLRDKGVLPDNDNHFVKTVKLAYAMDQDKAEALLERIEQGDQEAEQSLYVLAEQASELGLDETGVQQAFNAAREKQQAAQDKRDSKIQRYIEAIEQGRENITASSQPEAQPDLEDSLSFDEPKVSDLPTEADYQQQAIQESVKANVEQSAQSRGEFSNRPNTMKMREEGKKPIADYAAFTKKTKSMRKRLKKRMAQSNPQLRDALLESLRNAPERIAAFEQEAKERKARFDALPENQVRRQQVEALFDPQQPEPANEPDFSRNAIKQVMDDMRERGEPIIQSLPKEEQAEARADLRKAQSFATTKLRMMIDEAQSDNTQKEQLVDGDKIINASGLKLVLPEISKETESTYNRATHIGKGRDFNAELAEEAKKIAGDLDEKGLLDTEDRQQKAQSLIEDYLNEEKAFIERESARAASNPSWFVTGRGGRNMAKYSAKADKNMAAFSREVEKLSAMRKRISQDVEAVMNEEQRQARQEKERRDNLSRAEKKAVEYLATIAQNMREGKSALAKDDRKWAGPKALTHLNLLASADEARAKALAKKMEEGFKDVGGVLKVAGPRSKLAARLKELLDYQDAPKNSPATPTVNSAIPTLDAFSALNKGDMSLAEVKALSEQLTRNEQGVKDAFYSLTIPKINEKMGAYFAARWKGEKKDRIVQAAFDQLLSDLEFTMAGGAQTITLTQEGNGKTRAEQVNEKIQAMDDGTYQAFIDARKQAEQDRKEAIRQRKAALKDPQTISDFNLFVQNGGKFSPELCARYDKLVTDEILSRRKSEQETAAKKSGLETDGEIEIGDITEGTHGKTGATIFNVSLETRLGKDKFKEAAGMARSMKGGYWRGSFYFPTREDAEIFMGWLQGNEIDRSEVVNAKREEKRQSNAEKLREASEKLAEKASVEYNAERKENTTKRMAEGERARSRARKDAEIAALMAEVADKIESGDLSVLAGINAKTQVETLKRIENGLLWEASKKNSDAVERGDFSDPVWKEGATIDEKVMFAKYPMADTDTRMINELASRMLDEKGYAKSGNILLAKYKNSEFKEVALSTENEHVIKMVEFAKKEELYGDLPAMFQRLQRMGLTRRELLREALREMDSTTTKTGLNESKVAKLERDLKKKVLANRNAFVDFFPTPESRARHIVELADIEPGMKVLEPSAGNGMLADAAKSQGAEVEVVEIASDLRDILTEKGHKVVGNDFLAFSGKGYDRIVMNPPFSNDMDIDHVRHAYDMLKPGGKMVTVMSSMAGERSNNKNRAFKDWLVELDAKEEMDPVGTFKESMNQTGVRTKTIQIEKPLSDAKKESEAEAVMFSREGVTQGNTPPKGMPLKQAQLGVKQWLKEYSGGAGIKTKVVQTQAEAEKLLGQSIPGATIHGFYSDRDGAVVLVADNLPDMKTLRKKLRHEVLAHHGLKAVVGDSEYQKILERIARGKSSPHVKELWDRIEINYGDQAPIVQVEEVLAHAAEIERSTIQRWWDRAIEAIARALRKVGFMRQHDITKAEINNIVQTLIDRIKAVNHWDANNSPRSDGKSKLSRSKLSQAKFSLQQESARFSDELRKAMGSLKSRVAPIKVSDTPDVLKALGMPELPLYIDRDVVRKATNGVKDDHDISMESIYRLPELLADPIAVFKPKAPNIAANGSKNIIVAAQSDTGKPVLIAIHADKTSHRIRVNSVASAYGKNEKALTQWIRDGLLEYVKENNPEWLRLQGLQLPEERTFHQGYLDKIMSHQDVVNMGGIKFSKTSSPTMDEVIRQIDSEPTAHGRLRTVLSAVATAVKGELGGKKGLGAVTLRQLADLAKDKLPQIKGYVDTVHRMMERRNQMAFESAEIAQSIRKWAAKNKPMADEMFDIAHQATVEGVDPAESFVSAAEAIQNRIRHIENVAKEDALTNAQADELRQLRNDLNNEPRRLRKHIALRKRFDKLPAEAKTHYRTMRDNYKARHDDYRRLLEQQIQNAEIDGRVKKKRLAELRSLFDLQEVNAPYFPLARFGDYWVHAIDENGESRYLMFESEAEQQQTVKGLREKGFEVRSGYKMEGNPAIDGASLSFVTDLMGRIDETSLNDKKKTEIKDQIYQMYLQALPSRSMRKQFIHRKKTQGWSNDALRAMAENMMKGAYQLSRMEYAEELTKQVKETEKAAKSSNDNQAGRYAEELIKRHQWVMNPTHSVAAQKITSLGFLWMLGVSPAAAAVNTTQNFVVALPIMASKFGSAASTKALNGAMREFVTSRGQISRKFRNQSEKDAYNAWHDMGLLDSTNAHDLAGMAEAENWKYNEAYEKAMGVVSWLFHKAEVFNRETTAIAAYRLARQNGHEHDVATKMAADITWDAHFDYTNANRARYMQAPSMKVIMQFKQYSQNMTYYLLRNLYLSMKGASNSERAEARKQLIGTLGITALLGGATALPLGTLFVLANGLNAAFGDDDKPWDAEIEFKNYLGELLGEGLADKVIYGAGGAGVSSRISLDGLWIRDPSRDLEGEDLWTHYAKQVAGPVLGGIVVSAISGGHDISDGNIYRGVEKMMPKFARDPMKAYRYWNEGALNYRGNAYKEADQFSGLQLLLQANGLTDGELMKQYDVNNAIKGYEKHILDRRRDLMTAYWLAYKQHDEPMMLEAKRSIYKFNQANPGVAIDSQALRNSIKTRRRYSRDSNRGINVSKKLSYLHDEFAW